MSRRLISLLCTLSLAALACEPIVMIPGGALSGEIRPPPESWAFTDAVDTVQLETRPDDPYSVNIWCVAAGDDLFVAGSRSSAWTQNARADGRVRLRVDDVIYEVEATEADAERDVEAFLAAAKRKYDFEPDPGQREESVLFRLTAR